MKAVVFYENGGVDKLTYTDVEKPKISPYEVPGKGEGVCVESSGYLGKTGIAWHRNPHAAYPGQ